MGLVHFLLGLLVLQYVNTNIIHSPGDVYPSIVEMAVGSSVNITCTMNPSMLIGYNSSDLHFINTNTDRNVSLNDILILNATTIVYMLRDAVEQATVYLCKCGKAAIMNAKVYVGTSPREVIDFKCRNFDFDYMLCNFTQSPNQLLTQYNLSYHLHTPTYTYYPTCNYDGKPYVVCNTTLTERSRSHLEHFQLNFQLTAGNALGTRHQTFTFNILDITVWASVPDNTIKQFNVSTNSIELLWRMPKLDLYRTRGLLWQVWVQPLGIASTLQSTEMELDYIIDGRAKIMRRTHSELILQLNDLPYAFYMYKVRVRARVAPIANMQMQHYQQMTDMDMDMYDIIEDELEDHVIEEEDEERETSTGRVRRTSKLSSTNNYNAMQNDDDLWSDTFSYHFRTAARLPDRPPRTNVGSFYIFSTETQVRLYWEQLTEQEHNGDNFTYAITKVWRDGQIVPQKPLLLELNSAIFEWQRSAFYRFEIHSQNHLGYSAEASYIDIPSQQIPAMINSHTPPIIHNVYHATNRSYTLTWQPPAEKDQLKDYTVYWCRSKRALQNECKGSIHFSHVPSDVLQFATINSQQIQASSEEYALNLAVSANYENYNTGMHWTPCTMDVNSELVKMEPEVLANSPYTLRIQWSLERICPAILLGYNISICSVEQSLCRTINIQKSAKKYDVIDLEPYTMYSIQMLMYSALKVGMPSDAILVRTLEAAPTPPHQLWERQRRCHSLTIAWLPPMRANGIIRGYYITSKDHTTQLERRYHWPIDNGMISSTTGGGGGGGAIDYTLRNLTAYTTYSVRVSAYTTMESAQSQELFVITQMGVPEPPGAPTLAGDHEPLIEWSAPKRPAGRLDFYEVAVTQWHGEHILRRRISIVMPGKAISKMMVASCVLSVPSCKDDHIKLVVEVRAVNAAQLATDVNDGDELDEPERDNHDMEPLENYLNNDDLICSGRLNMDSLQEYRNSTRYRLYRSIWQHGPTYGCSTGRFNHIWLYVALILFMAVGITLCCWFGQRKIVKMSSIECTFPPDLNICLTKDGQGPAGSNSIGSLTTPTLSLYQSPLTAFANGPVAATIMMMPHHTLTGNNEKHHLLAFVGNDSGYLEDSIRQQKTNTNAQRYYRRDLSSCSTTSSVDSLVTTSTPPMRLNEADEDDHIAEQMEMEMEEDLSSGCGGSAGDFELDDMISGNGSGEDSTKSQLQTQPSGYVNPTNWAIATKKQQQTPAVNGGYVDVNNVCGGPNHSSASIPASTGGGGGYVQPHQLQNFQKKSKVADLSHFQGGSYVTPDNLILHQHHLNSHSDGVQTAALNAIDGYVTQQNRTVNSFGYQQHPVD